MDKKQASNLKIGDRVSWQEPDGMTFTTTKAIEASGGMVVDKGYSGFKVRWDDGVECIYRNDSSPHIHRVARAAA